ncbi:hypothetical protein Tco_1017852 [Tanacetum coccineum]|uniref:Uncharacterized protein n=1 Tax=Tanacetum coccineum TaxID=301880 RepID=A0ABQ5FUM1_9ASTR
MVAATLGGGNHPLVYAAEYPDDSKFEECLKRCYICNKIIKQMSNIPAYKFEVELHGAQRDREAGVFQVTNDDTVVAHRRLKDKQPEEKKNTDCLVKEQEKEYQTGWKIKTGIQQQNRLVDETNVTFFDKVHCFLIQSGQSNILWAEDTTSWSVTNFLWAEDTKGLRILVEIRFSQHERWYTNFVVRALHTVVGGGLQRGLDITSLDVGMLDKFDRGLQTDVQCEDAMRGRNDDPVRSGTRAKSDRGGPKQNRSSCSPKKFLKVLAAKRSYALSWKPCQGDSLNLPDHRIHKDGDGDALYQLKSDSLPHAHAQTTKTYNKHQDSRIMKAQELKTKTSA